MKTLIININLCPTYTDLFLTKHSFLRFLFSLVCVYTYCVCVFCLFVLHYLSVVHVEVISMKSPWAGVIGS